jgi:uroporphyrin-3 C-methyltransferase
MTAQTTPSPEPPPSANDEVALAAARAGDPQAAAGAEAAAAGAAATVAAVAPAAAPEAAGGRGAPEPAPAERPRAAEASWWSLLLSPVSMLLIAAIAIIGWQWYDSRTSIASLRAELAQRLAEADQLNRDSRTIGMQTQELVRELQGRTAALEARIGESQSQLIALDALYQQLARGGDEGALAEIEQILLLATQQLQLAGNVRAALIALQTADARLQRLERPQLAPLRKVLARDMQTLAAVPVVDYTGIALRLDQAAAAVDRLALPGTALPPPAAEPAPADAEPVPLWRRAWRALAREFREVVTVQRADRVEPPLLAPEQSYFLRENLRLRLLSARIALLARDTASFRADLEAATRWIDQHFDPRDPAVIAMLATLRPLGERELHIELPDISASLEAVRSHRLTRERQLR